MALRNQMTGRNDESSKDKRAPPLISTATGGLMPGIDLDDLSALQEMDGLEYVERMKHFK
jgi:hypothetical protein